MCALVSECSEPDHHDETFRMMVETWFYEHFAELKEFGDTLPKYDAFLEAPPEDDVDVWALQHALDRGFNAVLFGDGESGKTMEVHKVAPSTDIFGQGLHRQVTLLRQPHRRSAHRRPPRRPHRLLRPEQAGRGLAGEWLFRGVVPRLAQRLQRRGCGPVMLAAPPGARLVEA